MTAKDSASERTPRELTALAWAALSVAAAPLVKLQAMDGTDLLERLALATRVLRMERETLRSKLEALQKESVVEEDEDDEGGSVLG